MVTDSNLVVSEKKTTEKISNHVEKSVHLQNNSTLDWSACLLVIITVIITVPGFFGFLGMCYYVKGFERVISIANVVVLFFSVRPLFAYANSFKNNLIVGYDAIKGYKLVITDFFLSPYMMIWCFVYAISQRDSVLGFLLLFGSLLPILLLVASVWYHNNAIRTDQIPNKDYQKYIIVVNSSGKGWWVLNVVLVCILYVVCFLVLDMKSIFSLYFGDIYTAIIAVCFYIILCLLQLFRTDLIMDITVVLAILGSLCVVILQFSQGSLSFFISVSFMLSSCRFYAIQKKSK